MLQDRKQMLIGRQLAEGAEVLARHTQDNPAVQGTAVTLIDGIAHPRVKSAVLTIDGMPIKGFIKPTSRKIGGLQVLIADLALLFGAASAPCVLVETARQLVTPIEVVDEPGIGIFSAAPFAAYDTIESRLRILAGADLVSLSSGLQFRALLNDIDPPEINVARCKNTGQICFFDHERSWPDRDGFVHEHNKATIESTWHRADDGERREIYLASQMMAQRIYMDGETTILSRANQLTQKGLQMPKRFVTGLLNRTELFERPVIVDPLKRAAGLVI